ncbi:MAG TPA: ABC transporter ATP-binding protein [Methylomirabilota bacterium]|nr:ABC transporter ATP-binding protein [Methylomirabilota bacterium]
MSALTLRGLEAGYGATRALTDVSLEVRPGELVALIGGNGAGKTTLLKTIAGLLHPRAGSIRLDDEEIGGRPPWWVAHRGITLVPEGRGIFGDQTVRDNLALGALSARGRPADTAGEPMEHALALFPALHARLGDPAGSLSGGQQQMLALARGLMARPRVLLLDEPSLGLAPLLLRQIFEALARLRGEGLTILLVEQMAAQALALADRAYVLASGRITVAGTAAEVRADPGVIQAYLGRGGTKDLQRFRR